MKMRIGKFWVILAVAFAMIVIILGSLLPSQLRKEDIYYNAVVSPDSPNGVYAQKIVTDIVSVDIDVLKVERDFPPDWYRLTIALHNNGEDQYEYHATLVGYSFSLLCDPSDTEIVYGDNYSSGENKNARTVYYFVPNSKVSQKKKVGELSFSLRRNDLTDHEGVAQIEIAVFKPGDSHRIATVTQEIRFDLIDEE